MNNTSAPTLPISPSPCHPLALPPTPRDFEIFEQNQIAFLSTRRVAENHRLSQTRVRQIVARVAEWLSAHLPAKTDAQKEVDLRFAQHLAAAQLRRQIEQCQNYFDGSGDPKYLRHQTRVILALARLGVLPGAIDSLAADFTAPYYSASDDPPPIETRSVSEGPSDLVTRVPPGNALPRGSSLVASPKTPAPASPTDHGPLTTDSPNGACSPSGPQSVTGDSHLNSAPAATSAGSEDSADLTLDPQTTRAGLQIMERRLLTLLAGTPNDHLDRRHSLQSTLADVRSNLASLELRLSPDHPGAALTSGETTSPAPTTPPFPSHQSITLTH